MSDIAIHVEGLGKQYRIGALQKNGGRSGYKSLRESIANVASVPFRVASKLLGRRNNETDAATETFWALKDVSFDVKRGEIVGVIGRNGAGKSTLLKVLSRITEPTTGHVEIHGRIGSLLEVGTGFHPELSGRDNVFLNGAILGMKRCEIARQFDEIVAFAEVERFIDTPVKHYSSGMYLRLAFAVAAHLETEVLIVDEVLAVGDIQFQKKCLGKMKDVSSREGRTVLFVSHNLEAVSKLCNLGILLDQGTLLHKGTANSAIGKYITPDSSLRTRFKIPPPTEENAPAYATELIIENIDEQPHNGFAVGEPWQIRVSFTVTRRTEHFISGIGIVSNRGIPIWTVWTKASDLTPGHYCALYRNDKVSLCAGSFSIAVGLSSYEQTFHYAEEIATLVLVEVGEYPEALRVNGNSGFIVNPMLTAVFQAHEKDPIALAKKR